MGADTILVIGAGAAGLSAAHQLSSGGHDVVVIEARDRLGGRIHTLYPPASPVPIELGAEFIHGDRNATWGLAGSCEIETTEMADRHWELQEGKWRENMRFWDELESVMEKLQDAEHDQPFASFMRRIRGVPQHARSLVRDYVEGFHAARPEEIGVVALTEAEEAGEKAHGQRQFHINSGYSSLIDCMAQTLDSQRAHIHCNAAVELICWRRGKVEAFTDQNRYFGRAAIVTVPLGVLQAEVPRFDPPLPQKRAAAASLRAGNITKLALVFDRPIWPRKLSGFLHVHGAPFPTWWIHERAPVLTAWAGGLRTDSFSTRKPASILDTAVTELARIFHRDGRSVESALRDSFFHDWRRDRFSRGAYSYVPAGQLSAVQCLSEPVEDTLFFAGEALAPSGEQGTVHGAIGSGISVAQRLSSILLP
jgi:monoamine oxidase